MLQPVADPEPYIVQAGRTIPIRFTLTDFLGNFTTDQRLVLELVNDRNEVVFGPIGLDGNPAQAIVIQGEKYHFNLSTNGLEEGVYKLRIYYNATEASEPFTLTIYLVSGKK